MARLCRDLWLLIHLPAETTGPDRRDSRNGFLYQRRARMHRKWGRVCFWNRAQNNHSCVVCTNRAASASPWRWGPSPGSIWRGEWCFVWSWSGGGRWPWDYRPVVPAARPVCAASPSNGGWCRPGTPPGRGCRSAGRQRRICEEWRSHRYYLLSVRDVHEGAESQGRKTGNWGLRSKCQNGNLHKSKDSIFSTVQSRWIHDFFISIFFFLDFL